MSKGFHIYGRDLAGKKTLLLGNVLHAIVPRLGDTVKVHGTHFKVVEVEHDFPEHLFSPGRNEQAKYSMVDVIVFVEVRP
jgi:hypothetical protein